jgi:hypothetical protein
MKTHNMVLQWHKEKILHIKKLPKALLNKSKLKFTRILNVKLHSQTIISNLASKQKIGKRK